MTIQQLIEAAIEGGFIKITQGPIPQEEFNKNAKVVDSFGYYGPCWVIKFPLMLDIVYKIEEIVMNPDAWKAVGKVKGWGQTTSRVCVCGMCVIPDEKVPRIIWEDRIAQEMMTRMVIALNDGKTLEEYIATL